MLSRLLLFAAGLARHADDHATMNCMAFYKEHALVIAACSHNSTKLTLQQINLL